MTTTELQAPDLGQTHTNRLQNALRGDNYKTKINGTLYTGTFIKNINNIVLTYVLLLDEILP